MNAISNIASPDADATHATALEGAAAEYAGLAPASWETTKAACLAAWAAFEATVPLIDGVLARQQGRKVTEADHVCYEKAHQARLDAISATMKYPVDADQLWDLISILERVQCDEEDIVAALAAHLKRLFPYQPGDVTPLQAAVQAFTTLHAEAERQWDVARELEAADDPGFEAAEDATVAGFNSARDAFEEVLATACMTQADVRLRREIVQKHLRDGYVWDANRMAELMLEAELPAPMAGELLSTASAAQFAAWNAEFDRLTGLECNTISVTPEGRAQIEAYQQAAHVELHKLIDAPCSDLAAASAKVDFLRKAFTEGDTGSEEKVAEQVLDYLARLAVAATAPEPTQDAKLSSAVAAALAAEAKALDAHNAAIDAYTVVERRVFAKEIDKDHPDYIAVDEAQGRACHDHVAAWAAAIETPAVTMADYHAKLELYLLGEITKPDLTVKVYPDEEGQVSDHAARGRLMADRERVGKATVSATSTDHIRSNCPVAALIDPFQQHLDAEVAAGDRFDAVGSQIHYDAVWDLTLKATNLQATSLVGAAFQAALLDRHIELIRGNDEPWVRERHANEADRLLKSVLNVIGGVLPAKLWEDLFGSAVPHPAARA